MAETKDKLYKVIKSFKQMAAKVEKAKKGLRENAPPKTPTFKYEPKQTG